MADQKIGKKLVNDPINCVEESLRGYVAAHQHLKLLSGYNIVVRADLLDFKKQEKVSLISGGGSGHEPAHIGYVGKGMLTGAVCGDVFTSPSSIAILTAIRTCTSSAGVLLIVKNYTGDRLHFGKALEVAKSEGIKVEMIIVDEDCALTSADMSAGRRGLCGTLLVHKIAGSMAEEGVDLETIHQYLSDHVIPKMGTISLSLSACSIPGKPSNFTVDHHTVEFGLGIHGEAGIYKSELLSAKDLVKKLSDHLISSPFMPDIKGENVILIINNLGATTNLELGIISLECRQYLQELNVKVLRCFMGTMMTSLEMAGVSLSVMLIEDDAQLKYLDMPCHVAGWPGDGFINEVNDIYVDPISKSTESTEFCHVTPTDQGKKLADLVRKICEELIAKEQLLNELDRVTGDGDTGISMSRGASAILHRLQPGNITMSVNNLKDFFMDTSRQIENSVSGSSGALISALFASFSSKLERDINLTNVCDSFDAGVQAMIRYGRAEEGYRTMLDALCPAVRALKDSCSNATPTAQLVSNVAEAARKGADSTKGKVAKAGRASYVTEVRSEKNDPGAEAAAIVFETLAKLFR